MLLETVKPIQTFISTFLINLTFFSLLLDIHKRFLKVDVFFFILIFKYFTFTLSGKESLNVFL